MAPGSPLLAVIAFPDLSTADTAWVEDHRKRHDAKMAARVAAHFTFVFPAPDDSDDLVHHVSGVVAGMGPLPFVIRGAKAVKDAFSPATHGFLVPDEGRDVMIWLHAQLHGGRLASRRRAGIPFVPHITVGHFDGKEDADRFAAEINGAPPAIAGTIRALDVVAVEEKIRTIARVNLA